MLFRLDRALGKQAALEQGALGSRLRLLTTHRTVGRLLSQSLRNLCPLGVSCFVLMNAGCEEAHTTEPTVEARPGIEQVGDADGPLLDEDEACEQLKNALEEAKADNDCDDVSVPQCPELVRPGGSLACVRFAQDSVEGCVERIADYDACGDFVLNACVVVAVVDEMTEGCIPPSSITDAGTDAGATAMPGDAGEVDPGGDSGLDFDAGSTPRPDAGPGASAPDAAAEPEPSLDAGLPPGADAAPSLDGGDVEPSGDAGPLAEADASLADGG